LKASLPASLNATRKQFYWLTSCQWTRFLFFSPSHAVCALEQLRTWLIDKFLP
jgi:hypothetical protein